MQIAQELVLLETQEELILTKLSLHFDGAEGLQLFERVFLWQFDESRSHRRQRPIIEEALDEHAVFQQKGILPTFFKVTYWILLAREKFTEGEDAPYAREHSPEFWKYVFCEHFGEDPTSDSDKRWEDLFREGIPIYRKLQTAS